MSIKHLLTAFLAFTTLARAQEAPRVAQRAPHLQLPRENGTLWDSRANFAQSAQFWLWEGEQSNLSGDETVAKSAQNAAARGFASVLLTANPDAPTQYRWPAPFVTARVENSVFADLDAPSLLVIDRFGWIRQIEPLPVAQADLGSFDLRWFLEKLPDPTPKFEIGQPAPDFAVRDAQNHWHRVADLRGQQNLVLTFFPKCFTGRCKTHLSSLRDAFPEFRSAQTQIWAVSVDGADGERGQRAFAQSLNLPFPLLPDEGRNICSLYGAVDRADDSARRQTVIIDKNGIVRALDREVRPESHAQDVLALLRALKLISNVP